MSNSIWVSFITSGIDYIVRIPSVFWSVSFWLTMKITETKIPHIQTFTEVCPL